MFLKNKAIMLIEDDDVDAQAVKRVFKDLEIMNTVKVVKDGEAALDLLDHQEGDLPGLILLDINMPKMNGIEFLKKLKQNHKYKRIPAVVLTTSKADQDILRGYEEGAAGYLIKDIDYPKFIDTLRAIVVYWDKCENPN